LDCALWLSFTASRLIRFSSVQICRFARSLMAVILLALKVVAYVWGRL